MGKIDFLMELSRQLAALPEADAKAHLDYYREILEDMIEDGVPEEEAVARLGSPEALAADLLQDAPEPPRNKAAEDEESTPGSLFSNLGINISLGSAEAFDDEHSTRTVFPAEQVRRIEVSWPSCLVEILPCAGTEIQLLERSSRPLRSAEQMLVQLDASTLHIRSAQNSAQHLPAKALRIMLPTGFSLDRLQINTVSAEAMLEGFHSNVLNFRSTSGNLYQRDVSIGSAELNTVSGDFHLSGAYQAIRTSSISGDLSFEEIRASSLEFSVSSGDVELTGTTETVRGRSVSGDLTLDLEGSCQLELITSSGDISVDAIPVEAQIRTTSGDVRLTMSDISGFELESSTVTGDLDSDFPLTFANRRRIYGNGAAKLRIKTTSGDITLCD